MAHIHHHTLLVAMTAALAATSVYLALARWAAGDLATLVREVAREEPLAWRLAVAQRFTEGKRRAAAELIAGRISLRQAVERFRELNASVEGGDGQDGVTPFRVAFGEAALWRNVLLWVEGELRHRPDRTAAVEVLTRLQAEYREGFGHDPEPVVVLPPTP